MARLVHLHRLMAFRCFAVAPLIAPLMNVLLASCNAGDSTAPNWLPELPDASELPEAGAHPVGMAGTPSFSSSGASPAPSSSGSSSGSSQATNDAAADASKPEASLPYDSLLGIGCTGASPGYAADIVPIVRGCAAGEICHGTQFDYAGLVNATTQRDVCNPARVIVKPSDLGNSYILNKLLGIDMCAMSSRMPIGGIYLPQAQVQTMADWICVGAPND
jgi:hypothetical protein